MTSHVSSYNIIATNVDRRAFGEPCFGDDYNMRFGCRSQKLKFIDLAPQRGSVGVITAQPVKSRAELKLELV